jgi:hypothetical protein
VKLVFLLWVFCVAAQVSLAGAPHQGQIDTQRELIRLREEQEIAPQGQRLSPPVVKNLARLRRAIRR